MDILPLVSDANSAQPVIAIKVRVAAAEEEFGRACRVAEGVLRERRFTSLHEHREELELRETVLGPARLTAHNPFLTAEQRNKLDAHGMIRPGNVLEARDILISVLRARRRPLPPEAPARGMEWVEDASLPAPLGWEGAKVVTAEHFTRRELGKRCPRGVESLTAILLRAERDLEAGDVLLIGKRPAIVAGALPDNAMPLDAEGQPAEIVVSRTVASLLGLSAGESRVLEVSKGCQRAADVIQARGTGPYSLISVQPLGPHGNPGQRVHSQHAAWLWQHGLDANRGELTSLKSDDVAGRAAIVRALLAGERLDEVEIPTAGAPDSLTLVVAWLQTLGFTVALQRLELAVGIRIEPAATADVLAMSHGHVRKPDTINYRTYADEEGGLFCPKIFGDGQYPRRRRFGHVPLPAPIVPLIWRTGEPSLVAALLNLPAGDIERIVAWSADVWWRDGEVRLEDRAGQSPRKDHDWELLGTGGPAIRSLLERLLAERLPEGLRGRPAVLTLDAILVPPPDLRPLVLLASGDFATSDLNDLLRQVMNRRNRLVKLIELNAPQAVVDSEHRELQESIDALHGNCLFSELEANVGDQGRPLVCTLALLHGHLAKGSPKKVDWSARARVVMNPTLARHRALVPRLMFETLQLEGSCSVLLTRETGDGRMIAAWPAAAEEAIIQLSPEDYRALDLPLDAVAECLVHRPLSSAAKTEVRDLLERGPRQVRQLRSPQDWLAAETPAELARLLAHSAASPRVVALDSPRHLLVGGCGAIDIPPDARESSKPRRDRLLQVPIPPEQDRPKSKPTREQVLTALQEYRRSACIFTAEPAAAEPPAAAGRLGGRPYLPAGTTWPTTRGKPMQFVGQLPLEPARAAGLLPIEVPRNALLTIFWDGEWEPRLSAAGGPVFIHPIAGCVLTEPPDDKDLEVGTLCSLRHEIVEEVPQIKSLLELLEWDLERPDLKALRKLLSPDQLPAAEAREAVKLGGWPHWVQNGVEDARLLAQIASTDEADVMFGDAGSLYILARDDGQLEMLMECY